MRMLKWGVLVAGILAPALLRAEELPDLDARIFCVSTGNAGCVQDEARRRGQLSERWNSYPAQRKHFCVQSVRFMREDRRSYLRLASCLNDPLIS
ncbi:MAG: hypothetical protein O9315_17375 [Beijerinckiaceae bacterium]|nr:hypothetical protein [Brevundimonas sp.]MCZ8302016.1 hypothetical protein [Beijerinckiaceae bacterium]